MGKKKEKLESVYEERLKKLNWYASHFAIDFYRELETFENKTALNLAIYADSRTTYQIVKRVKKFLEAGEGEKAISAIFGFYRRLNQFTPKEIEKLKKAEKEKSGRKATQMKKGVKK